jgi:methionyl-tRNA synthetase
MSQALLMWNAPLKPEIMSGEPYYITTAISYPNGKPHIGHAYEAIAADAIARFHRLSGRDVRFQTGTDEHGLKMVQTARDKGVDVRDLCREMSNQFQAMCDKLNISYDHFQRTTDPAHHRASVAIWEAMKANGDLYLDRYEGWYSVRDEAYYEEKELIDGEGTEKLSPQGTPVEWTVEESWFFKLSKYEKQLLELYKKQPSFIRPESRRNEVVRFVEGGLRDLSMSRTSFDWGVKVPGSPDHVMYVWVDALTNYLTGLGYPDMSGDMAKYWPANLHLIGKDIVRFHAVYWPAFLMSAGLPLPKQVFGHGFVLARGGEKMSKSLGNVVDPIELADAFGVDALRYFLLREVSFGQDGSYSSEAIVTRCNAELANSFGNLAQRVLSFIAKTYPDGLPSPISLRAKEFVEHQADWWFEGVIGDDNSIERGFIPRVNFTLMNSQMIDTFIKTWMDCVIRCNKFVDENAPWTLRKEGKQELLDDAIVTLFTFLHMLAIAIHPIIPQSADRLLDQMGIPSNERDFAALNDGTWYDRLRASGHRITSPTPIFPRWEMPVDEIA